MMSTRSPCARYSGDTIRSTLWPLVCEGAVVRNTVSGMVMGLCLRAYTTGTFSSSAVSRAGAMPLISAVRTLVGRSAAKRRANSCAHSMHQHGINLMVYEGIDFEDAAAEVAALGENALL